MAVVQTLTSAQGQAQFYTSQYLDNAGTTAAVHYPGFTPRKVRVFNITDSISYEWEEGSLAGTYTQTLLNGTRSLVTGGANLSVAVQGGASAAQASITHAVLTNKQYKIEAWG